MSTNLPVFVYGTLRTGEGNYAWALKGQTSREEPATLTAARIYDGIGFPFVSRLAALPTDNVRGDLMHIPEDRYDDVLDSLDGLEGYFGPDNPMNMYDRVLVAVTLDDGTEVEAYTYLVSERLFHNRVSSLAVITSGDWVTHDRSRPGRRLAAL